MPSRPIPTSYALVPPVRNRYFVGHLLGVEEFRREQEYHLNARRRLNLMLIGAGVVWGLGVSRSSDGSGIVIAPGIAIDRFGREIVVPAATEVCTRQTGNPPIARAAARLAVLLAYREELIEPVPTPDGDTQASLIRESFRIWCEPDRRAPGPPADPERDDAVLLAVIRPAGQGRVTERKTKAAGSRRKAG